MPFDDWGDNRGEPLLASASAETRDNKEKVLEAISGDGDNIKYASERLKGDRDVVLAAVAKSSSNLQYASVQMRDD
jgi:hypothetical protein